MLRCRLCRNVICVHVAAWVANDCVIHWECSDTFHRLPGSACWWHCHCERGRIRWLYWLWWCEVLLTALSLTVWSLSLYCFLLTLMLVWSARIAVLVGLLLTLLCQGAGAGDGASHSVVTLHIARWVSVAILCGSTRSRIWGC